MFVRLYLCLPALFPIFYSLATFFLSEFYIYNVEPGAI